MGNKITVEFKDEALYKDLQEIARLVKSRLKSYCSAPSRNGLSLREDSRTPSSLRNPRREYDR